jgi:hypothetical protein
LIKRLNYTGRRRIRREDVAIQVRGDGAGEPTFNAVLSVGRYRLPASARVFVEAYRQTSWQRFDFGTVGELRQPEDRRLSAFGSVEGVFFRIKIVEAAEPGDDRHPPARILRHADRIRPRTPDEAQRKSLLPLDPGDFRDEVWRLEFDETGPPVLKVSRHLVPDWHSLPRTMEFLTLALPDVFRSILIRILLIDEHTDLEDMSDWRTQWLRFTLGLPGVSDPPPADGDTEQWIDEAVGAFSRHTQIARRFREWWRQED